MYLDKIDYIFVHCPKTGGNTIASMLWPYSSENKTISGHQDGLDRFEIVGQFTKHKHQTLAEYRKFDELATKTFFVALRHPVERLVSWYFSPHRWLRSETESNGNKTFRVAEEPSFDLNEFEHLINTTFLPQHHYVSVAGVVEKPDYIVDFSNFAASFAGLCKHLQVEVQVPVVTNKSVKDKRTRSMIAGDPVVIDLVKRSRHGLDWQYFPEMGWR